tara:strand:+ start:2732 stop:3685 length:954 start_codon:yes stop_codon:yes gene_type:complete
MKIIIIFLSYLTTTNSFIHNNFNKKLYNRKLTSTNNDDYHYNFYLSQAISIFDNNILNFLKKRSQQKYNYIDVKNDNIYNYSTFSNKYKYLKEKKLISISPGGTKGFYYMGLLTYMKEQYNFDNFIFTGASAGAWASLFSTYKYSLRDLSEKILSISLDDCASIFEVQLKLKSELLKSYSITDFNLDKLFIGVTVLRGLELSTNIFFNFVDLEDVINCCIASSHIPFLTGGFINKYNNEISFDGGFSNSPYLDLNNTVIHINPNIWNTESKNNIIDYYDLIIARKESFSDLYDKGYYDTKLNKKRLRKKLFNNIKLK